MRGRAGLLIGLIWTISIGASAPSPNDYLVCADTRINAVDQILACTRLITTGGASESSLPDIYRLRGAANLRNKNIDSAILDFSEAINGRPNFASAYQNRGVAKFERGDYEAALADLNQAIGYDASSAVFFGFRGVILNAMGQYDRAIEDFDRALQIDKSYAYSYNNRGYAYQRKRMSKEAIADYTKAISLSPLNSNFYVGRASVKMDIGKLDEAVADLDNAIHLDSGDSEAFQVRAEAKRLRGDLEGAKSDCDMAIRLSPTSDSAYINRALVLRDQRQFDAMIASLGEAILFNPRNDLAFANRGEGHLLKGDLDQSLRDLDRAVELNPRSPFALTRRGDTLRAKGDFDRAIADYDAANLYVSNYVAAVVGRGLALKSKGDLAGAKAELERALELSPDFDRGVAAPAQAIARQALKEIVLPDPGVRVALVIGMSRYESVSMLDNPDRDATGVAEALKTIGFDSVTLILDATRSKLAKALREFQELADNADWAVVFYAGHGIEINGQNYLIPVDAQLETDRDADDEAVPLAKVLERIQKARKLQLVILDACRDNPFQATMRGRTREIVRGHGLAPIEPVGQNELIVYAAKDGEVADDGQNSQHSPFSAALIQRLKEPRVEINELFRNVMRDVYNATHGTQRPFVYGSSVDNFYFNNK